jgi:midasin
MSFLTQLSPDCAPRMEALVLAAAMPGAKPAQAAKALSRAPPEPPGGSTVLFESFRLERGPLPLPAGGAEDDGAARRFVLTPSVRKHLANIARAALVRKHPILLQVRPLKLPIQTTGRPPRGPVSIEGARFRLPCALDAGLWSQRVRT